MFLTRMVSSFETDPIVVILDVSLKVGLLAVELLVLINEKFGTLLV